MLKTPDELLHELGAAIRARRIGQRWSQEEAAVRAGMGVRTWRRMETSGQATIETLVNAAIALRCEQGLAQLFPAPAARGLDELLARQAAEAKPRSRQRAPRQAKIK
jgi:transcriptional regulator with XRE-family HTH domain